MKVANQLKKEWFCSTFFVSMVCAFSILFGICTNASAEVFVDIEIQPKNIGIFYQNETQQMRAFGITPKGEKVDITNEVQWSIDPAGYPHNSEQPLTPGSVATISGTGLVTVHSTWGRVVVYAKYTGGGATIATITSSLLRPSFTVTSSITGGATVDPEGEVLIKRGATAVYTITHTDPAQQGNTVATTCPTGSLTYADESNEATYLTGQITEDCMVEFGTEARPSYDVTSSLDETDNNGSISDSLSILARNTAQFDLSATDATFEASVVSDCPAGAGLVAVTDTDYTFTTGPIVAACSVAAHFTKKPAVTTTLTGGNGTIDPNGVSYVTTGDQLTINMSPDSGFAPSVVSDGCGSGTFADDHSTYTTAAIADNCTVEFSFVDQVQLTVVINEAGGTGGASSNPPGAISCVPSESLNDCDENYAPGTDVTLAAAAISGSFTGWSGCSSSTEAQITVTMTGDRSCTANFSN